MVHTFPNGISHVEIVESGSKGGLPLQCRHVIWIFIYNRRMALRLYNLEGSF